MSLSSFFSELEREWRTRLLQKWSECLGETFVADCNPAIALSVPLWEGAETREIPNCVETVPAGWACETAATFTGEMQSVDELASVLEERAQQLFPSTLKYIQSDAKLRAGRLQCVTLYICHRNGRVFEPISFCPGESLFLAVRFLIAPPAPPLTHCRGHCGC
jgi:hypothetical protein